MSESCGEQPGEKAGKQPVAEHMAAAIGVLFLVAPGADDHVELLGQELVDHRLRRAGIVGQVAVSHDVNVGIDVGEHAADDMALALLPLRPDDGAPGGRDFSGPVAAVVVG